MLVLEKTESIEKAGPGKSVAPIAEVETGLHPLEPEPPLADIIDPVAKLEPDLQEEPEEEGETN